MRTLVEADRILRKISFKFKEIYAIIIILILAGAFWRVEVKGLILSAFLLLSHVLYICGRCMWQYCFGPKYSAALVRSMAQKFAITDAEHQRATALKALQKDASSFSNLRRDVQGKIDALSRRIFNGDFDWPDISWWRAYHDFAKLMDEVLSK